jgi:hypothetical protein
MMNEPLRMSDAERRARLLSRHHLGRTAADVVGAVRGVVALHSTDPATPYLALRARVPDFTPSDLQRALFEDRSLWRMHAMRRTLFVVPADDAPVFEAGASRDVARQERRRLAEWLGAEMEPGRVTEFLADLAARVVGLLGDGVERRTQELTAAIPELGMQLTLGSGKWSTRSPLSSRLLFLMAMDGSVVRTRPAGSWRSSQYHWAAARTWFGAALAPMDPQHARAELARRYLAAYGPATLDDLRWWTGWTAKESRGALATLGAVPVRLDGGRDGFVLRDDTVEAARLSPAASRVALLPALDPTAMGWKHRDWYLGGHAGPLFDRSGNIGPSIWVDGRIVGGWGQRPDGEVVCRLLEDVGVEADRLVAEQAAVLTAWMAGVVVVPRFRTPLERQL